MAFKPHARRSTAPETPKPVDPAFARDEVIVLATARDALAAAAMVARKAGVAPIVLGDAVRGEARDVATFHARVTLALARRDAPTAEAHLSSGLVAFSGPACDLDPLALGLPLLPCVLISGGETTVTVHGSGRGGRNAEYALTLTVALGGHPAVSAIACDIDGTEDNAGAVVMPDTLAQASAVGPGAAAILANNDAYGFFAGLDDLIVTGPTRNNVNDFRAVLVSR